MDYSRTINRYTPLDAYPLPRIDDLVENISQYTWFSKLDLQSAYHQIPLHVDDKPYTAFEAAGNLYQFCRLPFGLTNAVSSFQRIMNQVIDSHDLGATFAYLDDIIVCGNSQEEHDQNLKRFLEMAEKLNLTLNRDKCIFSQTSIKILGYLVSNGSMYETQS